MGKIRAEPPEPHDGKVSWSFKRKKMLSSLLLLLIAVATCSLVLASDLTLTETEIQTGLVDRHRIALQTLAEKVQSVFMYVVSSFPTRTRTKTKQNKKQNQSHGSHIHKTHQGKGLQYKRFGYSWQELELGTARRLRAHRHFFQQAIGKSRS